MSKREVRIIYIPYSIATSGGIASDSSYGVSMENSATFNSARLNRKEAVPNTGDKLQCLSQAADLSAGPSTTWADTYRGLTYLTHLYLLAL